MSDCPRRRRRRHRLRCAHPRARPRRGRHRGAGTGRARSRQDRDARRAVRHRARDDRPREAFARDDVDVVAVTTPPHTHAEVVLDAVAAGKHVLCEKPFARDLAEAREMLRAADAAGVVHLLGTEFRFAPGQALLTRAVRSGAIGDPRFMLFVLQLPTLHRPRGRDARVVGRCRARAAAGSARTGRTSSTRCARRSARSPGCRRRSRRCRRGR